MVILGLAASYVGFIIMSKSEDKVSVANVVMTNVEMR